MRRCGDVNRQPVCSETMISVQVPPSPKPGIAFAADRCSFPRFRSPFRSRKVSFWLQTGAPSQNSGPNGPRRSCSAFEFAGTNSFQYLDVT